ncbi:MAG: hypothetical protein ACRDJW_09870 [Thermomicrobiales bacterium]
MSEYRYLHMPVSVHLLRVFSTGGMMRVEAVGRHQPAWPKVSGRRLLTAGAAFSSGGMAATALAWQDLSAWGLGALAVAVAGLVGFAKHVSP